MRRWRSGGATRCRRGARRTLPRRTTSARSTHDAIARVREEARPDPRDADELHDDLLTAGFLTVAEVEGLPRELARSADLDGARRTAHRRDSAAIDRGSSSPQSGYLRLARSTPSSPSTAGLHVPRRGSRARGPAKRPSPSSSEGRLTITGPITAAALAEPLGCPLLMPTRRSSRSKARASYYAAASRRASRSLEWCDRRLLARIHRYTLNRLRAEIAPVSPADFMRFLFAWQHVEPSSRLTGIDGLRQVLAQLDGYELAAGAWERAVLPARVDGYEPSMLDMLCFTGEIGWARLSPTDRDATADLVPRRRSRCSCASTRTRGGACGGRAEERSSR